MKKNTVFSLLLATIFGLVIFTSCKGNESKDKQGASTTETKAPTTESKTVKDDELKSFLLGGIYFTEGYGGKAELDKMLTVNGTDPGDIVAAAREYMILPFKPADGAGAKQALSSMWGVTSKETLQKTLDELKGHKMESSYTKSWDYARYVNNVCMAYAAGYVTEDESKKLVAEILPLAQADYKTWNDYYADFKAGRDKWSGGDEADKATFGALAAGITQGENNIYTILPLN